MHKQKGPGQRTGDGEEGQAPRPAREGGGAEEQERRSRRPAREAPPAGGGQSPARALHALSVLQRLRAPLGGQGRGLRDGRACGRRLQAENRREELGATGKLGTPCLPRAEVSLVPASHSPSPHGPRGNPLHSVLGGVTWLNPSSQDGGPLVVSAGVQKGAPRRGGDSSVRC